MSFVGLLFCLPIFCVIYILVKLDSPGPVFFLQKRVGKDGVLFNIIKFRSMVVDAEKKGDGLFNYEHDPRVTKVGAFLRSSSLDEIPQFINILKGDMSFVGPRPPVSYELGDYSDYSDELKQSFSIRPGVTGWAQVKGRNELNWEQKTKYNLEYLKKFKKYGVLLDFYIILMTIFKVLKNEGGYELSENKEADSKLSGEKKGVDK